MDIKVLNKVYVTVFSEYNRNYGVSIEQIGISCIKSYTDSFIITIYGREVFLHRIITDPYYLYHSIKMVENNKLIVGVKKSELSIFKTMKFIYENR